MKAYKLTDKNSKTHGTQWGEGITNIARGTGNQLCSADVIHVYEHELLAVFADPIHGNYGPGALLWECETSEIVAQDALKAGVKSCTTLRQIPKPVLTTKQRVEIGIRCALAVLPDTEWAREWRKWADRWLDGTDRTPDAAYYAAYYAAYSAAYSAATDATDAAYSAAFAAAAYSAAAAYDAAAYSAAAYSANAAYDAAVYAADAAHDAANGRTNILAIIKQVVQQEATR